MQNTPRTIRDFGGLKSGPVGVTSGTRFDLVLFVNDPDGNPFTTWMYNQNLFDARTIALLAGSYSALLQAVATNPRAALSSLKETLEETRARQRAAGQMKFQETSQRMLSTIRRKAKVAVYETK